MARLMEQYETEIQPALGEELGVKNRLAIPRLQKVVLSMGVGKALQEKKRMEAAAKDLGRISGQKPVICKARKSVSNFKLRKDYDVGCMVTLRGKRMSLEQETLQSTSQAGGGCRHRALGHGPDRIHSRRIVQAPRRRLNGAPR